MSLETRLSKLERGAVGGKSPHCTHVISVSNEGEPVPRSTCTCDGTHLVVVIRRVRKGHYEHRDTTTTT